MHNIYYFFLLFENLTDQMLFMRNVEIMSKVFPRNIDFSYESTAEHYIQ